MILPKDNCCPDITHCTGCEWESLLPLLAYLGLITVKVTSVVKQITIARSQWQEIVQALNRHIQIELTQIHVGKLFWVDYFVRVLG